MGVMGMSVLVSNLVGVLYEIGYKMHLTRRLELDILKKWIDFDTGAIVCDIGCGKGILDRIISRRKVSIYGLDLDQENITLAKRINNNATCHFVIGHGEGLPFLAGVFDNVVCNCSMEHFQDDIGAISEMNRILKPGGLLFVTVDSFSYPRIEDHFKELHRKKEKVVNFYDVQGLKVKLEGGGFRVKDQRYYIRSRISSFFLRLGARLKFGPLFILTFPFSYPLSVIGDHYSKEEGGYCLAMMAEKPGKRMGA